jgi:hypothetical protein
MIFARILIKRKVIIENNNIENIYIFMVYFTPNYLASRYLQKHAKVHYYISEAPITSPINLSMFSTWKYFESIICCSSFELEEVDILKENEMIYFDTKILW